MNTNVFQRKEFLFVRLVVNLAVGVCIWLPILCLAQSQTSNLSPTPNTIVIKGHQFEPQQLIIPASQKIQVIVDNQDPTPEEFESFDLDREQVVEGNKKIIVFIGPLKPGTYKYWADFHKSSTGVIIAQ